MARFKTVPKTNNIFRQNRVNFSGQHNDKGRVSSRIIVAAQQMLALLTANAVTFFAPPVTLVAFASLIADARAARQTWGFTGTHGTAGDKVSKDLTLINLNQAILANAAYVASVANSQPGVFDYVTRVLAQLEGGVSNKRRGLLNLPIINRNAASKTTRTPAAPRNLHIVIPKRPNPGFTRIRWAKSKGATSYIVTDVKIVNMVPVVTTTTVTSSAYVLTGDTGVTHTVTVVANGPNNTLSGNSQPFKFVAL